MSSIEVTLEAEVRTNLGKNASRQLRRGGKLPVALYGGDDKPFALAVDKAKLLEIFRKFGHTKIFNLTVAGGATAPVLIKEWQVDPLKGVLLHADLLRVDMAKATRLHVRIEVSGEAFGVKTQGGLLDISAHDLEIECLPGDIPDRIRVDVSELKIGQHLAVKDLKLGDRVKVLADPERVIVGVLAPRLEEAPAAAPAAAEPTEPEVIKKGKAEEKEGEEKEAESGGKRKT
jgi:large subunit ribosomal protein L25